MVACPCAENCGGCLYRNESPEAYRSRKEAAFKTLMSGLKKQPLRYGDSVFIDDGQRRRASLAFRCRKGKLSLGFNARKSAVLVEVEQCLLLTAELNAALPEIHALLEEICALPFVGKRKGKKAPPVFLEKGDVWICEADNGIDVVLEFDAALELPHRMAVFDIAQRSEKIIRISHRRNNNEMPEPIVEKMPPVADIAGRCVYIPAGSFMQASKAAEKALIGLVLKYLGKTEGRIADLFCGMGTFSYPLSQNPRNKITAVDSSAELLSAFVKSVNKNMISNIEIKNKNLFKYPLDETELKEFDAVVFDPPRAGAAAQSAKLANLGENAKLEKVIAVSCNPGTFVNDANTLLDGGFELAEITMVDQFVYSPHMELVALFCKERDK